MKLPNEENLLITDVLDEEEFDHLCIKIGDYLTDKYGYCVDGFCIDIKVSDIKWDRSE